jgi:hypothetical protein
MGAEQAGSAKAAGNETAEPPPAQPSAVSAGVEEEKVSAKMRVIRAMSIGASGSRAGGYGAVRCTTPSTIRLSQMM